MCTATHRIQSFHWFIFVRLLGLTTLTGPPYKYKDGAETFKYATVLLRFRLDHQSKVNSQGIAHMIAVVSSSMSLIIFACVPNPLGAA